MRFFIRYLVLEWKRSCKVLLRSLVTTLFAAALLALLAAGITVTMKKFSAYETIEVGLVVPEEEADPDTMFAISFLATMDSVKSISGFAYYDTEKQALADLQSGKLQSVISLPPYFFEDVDSGMNTPAVIYISENADLSTRIFMELLKDGVRILQIAEAGVYAVLDVAYEDRPLFFNWSEAGNTVAYAYVAEALSREGMFDKRVVSSIGTVGYEQFYFSAFLLILILISGWNFSHLYRKNSRVMAQKLKAEGLGCAKQTVIRILIMTLLLWLQALVLYLAAYGISQLLWYHVFVWDWIVWFGLLFISFSMACYFHFTYSIAGGDATGCVVLFALNVFMILSSGILIPDAYMPPILQTISGFLPLHWWDAFAMNTFYEDISVSESIRLLAASAIAAAAGGGVLWKNT